MTLEEKGLFCQHNQLLGLWENQKSSSIQAKTAKEARKRDSITQRIGSFDKWRVQTLGRQGFVWYVIKFAPDKNEGDPVTVYKRFARKRLQEMNQGDAPCRKQHFKGRQTCSQEKAAWSQVLLASTNSMVQWRQWFRQAGIQNDDSSRHLNSLKYDEHSTFCKFYKLSFEFSCCCAILNISLRIS